MKLWNVIFATLVIFGAGVLTGALAVNISRQVNAIPAVSTPPVATVGKQPNQHAGFTLNTRDREFIGRISAQLGLNTNQIARVEQILKESNDRVKKSLKEETKVVREKIRTELTDNQRKTFDEDAIKTRGPRKNEEKGPRKNNPSMRTNNPNAGSSD